MTAVRVRLLGGFEVEGFEPERLGSRKARQVLKVLALARGRPVSVDALSEVLWTGRLPARPGDEVQVLVSRLRAVLGADRLLRSEAGYALVCDWLDLDELEVRSQEAQARLAAGRAAAARAAAAAALRLARGPLLPGDEGDWVEQQRPAATRSVAQARVVAASAALALGDPISAAADAEAALDHDPYDEAVLRTLMQALAAAGRPASALAAYSRTRARLADDLGVGPAPETEALHTALLLDPAAVGAGSPSHRAQAVVGRDRELAVLDAELQLARSGSVRAVRVEGESGIGKTALVTAWSQRAEGAVVLTGRCDELGRDLPLQPVLDALDGLLRRQEEGEVDRLLGPQRDLLAGLLGAPAATDRPPLLPDPVTGQARLFGALLDVLQRAGGGGAVALVVEDLHLAAPGTVAWLRFAVRRGRSLLVVVTTRPGGPSVPGRPLPLGPLDRSATAALVGDDRAEHLHGRSGGNPLLLLELARAEGDDLPATVIEVVRARTDGLGVAAATVRLAASLGVEVDVDLVAAASRRPFLEVLDHVEAAVAAGLLVEHGDGFAFTHDVVREALAATVPAARRAFVHREAARALTARRDHHPLEAAFHARHGGEAATAGAALVAGAEVAAARYDLDVAEQLLDQAILLADRPAARSARARVRMARSDHAGAASDVAVVLSAEPDAAAYELAGWVAYYRREHAEARRHADAAIAQAGGGKVHAGALALAGRLRHSRGELHEARALLSEATSLGDSGEVARVWLGSLLVHQGELDAAVATVGSHSPTAGGPHPFAVPHGLFARALAHGLAGRLAAAFEALGDLDRAVARLGDLGRRFTPMAANLRGWLLRSSGRPELAEVQHHQALALATGTGFEEPRAHALLDLVELDLRDGRAAGAEARLAELGRVADPTATMAWHVDQRRWWLQGRADLAAGRAELALASAAELAADAATRGSPRHLVLGQHLELVASARAGLPVDAEELRRLPGQLAAVAGVDAWWLAAELAVATGSEEVWEAATLAAGRLVAGAGGSADVDQAQLGGWLDDGLAAIRRRWPRGPRSSARAPAARRGGEGRGSAARPARPG